MLMKLTMGALSFLPNRFFEELMALAILMSMVMGGLCVVLSCYDYSGWLAISGTLQLAATVFAVSPAMAVGKEFDHQLDAYRKRRAAYNESIRRAA